MACAALGAALFLIPIPYIIFGPGNALDLNAAIIVPLHRPPPGRLFLTDVNLLPGRPAFYAAAKMLPGFEIIHRRELVPASVSDRQLDVQLVDAMKESQTNAQIVAERAAGLPVKASSSFVVVRTVPGSPGSRCFKRGDRITQINGAKLVAAETLSNVTSAKPAGTVFVLQVRRHASRLRVRCVTFRYQGKSHFGITGTFFTQAYSLPVHVAFHVQNINGSSAGLMFALQIFRTLTGRALSHGQDVAGTGVLNADGSVGPIEGAREKVRAAQRAGAIIFLVPAQNYAQIKDTKGIMVIPVRSFRDALAELSRR